MRVATVRLSLPLMILLGVLLYAALMLAGKPSAEPLHVTGPAQNGFTKPEVRQAGPMQNGMDRPVMQANPVQGGFIKLAAGPYNTPLTIPYIP